ncbi:MAG: MFS transporter [Candidatus Kariarchaeaceae archaeon]
MSYASASFSAALLLQYFQSKAEFFYITEMKLDPGYYALALVIFALWNSINDPLAGWIMDRKVTRWGRRLPWMVLFWIPLIISFGLIWSPPQQYIGDTTMLFIWLVVVLLIFDTAYTVVILAWVALFPEIYTNHKERYFVSGLRQVFSLFALILALILPPFFVKDNDIDSYASFGWFLALVCFVNLGLAFRGCRERQIESSQNQLEYSLKDGIDLVLHNRSYKAFLFANLITYFAYGQVLSMLPFYRDFVLDIEEEFETSAYAAAIGITMLTLFFWVWLTSRKDPRFTFLLSAIAFALALAPIWFTTNPDIIIILMGLVGFGLAGLLMVVDLLLSDVIDEDFLRTGKHREGIFFGFNGFFIRIAILMQAIALAITSKVTGFDENKEIQSESAQQGIKIQMIILPIIAFIVAIYVVRKYYYLHGEVLLEQHNTMRKLETNS